MAESDLIRGNVDTVILKVLYDGDRYGYDIIKQINAKSGGQWEIKQPTVYAALKRLEKQGFVSSYWDASESNGGRRKYFSLTDEGRKVFITYKNEWERTRDLFGELITDDAPLFPVDDFSDVEEESYQLPKRRAVRHREKPKAEKTIQSEQTDTDVTEKEPDILSTDESDYYKADDLPIDDVERYDDDDADAQDQSARPIEDGAYIDEQQDIEQQSYVQSSFFDNSANVDDKTSDNLDATAIAEPLLSATDPHALIEEIFAATYTGNGSYTDARSQTHLDEYDDRLVTDGKPKKSVAETNRAVSSPAASSATLGAIAPAKSSDIQPASQGGAPQLVSSGAVMPIIAQEPTYESLARREYRDILGDLVEKCEASVQHENGVSANAEQAAATSEIAERNIEFRPFKDAKEEITELGNEVTVRKHNDSAKQYTQKYYYYSNRLMMTHYTVMCAVMFLLGLTMFLTFYIGLKMRMPYDYILYIFAGLLPILMFVAAVIIFASDPDRKKRININFKFSIVIRTIIMIQVAVVIYCFNLIWGMPVSFSVKYVPSLVIPLLYAIFIPVSEWIFATLLKSGKYAAE